AESGLTAVLAELGRFEEAHAHGATSIRIGETLNHTYTLVFALRTIGHAYTVEGRLAEAITILERGRALCDDTDLLSLAPIVMAALGYALSLAERPRDGVKLIEDAIAALEGYGQRVWYALMLAQLGEAHGLGDLGAADAHRTKARDIRRTIGIATPSALEPDEPSGV